jgi:tetratricopeptide (TPR) repeat protein
LILDRLSSLFTLCRTSQVESLIAIGLAERACQHGFRHYNTCIGEQTTVARRHVRPWILIAIIGAAVLVFTGVGLLLGGRRLDREFGRPHSGTPHHRTRAERRANSLCKRLNVAGNSYAMSGLYDSALACYREVLRVSQEEGLSDRMAAAYANMSNVFDYLNMPESVRFYMSAATALNRLSNKRHETTGDIIEEGTFRFNSLGDVDSGKALLEKGLLESRGKGDSVSESRALNNLGLLHATLKHYDTARVLFESCLAIDRARGDQTGQAAALRNIALIYWRRDRLDDARKWLLKCIEAAHAGRLFSEEAWALYDVALLRAEGGEYALAQANAERAIGLFRLSGEVGAAHDCQHLVNLLVEVQRWHTEEGAIDSMFRHRSQTANPGS